MQRLYPADPVNRSPRKAMQGSAAVVVNIEGSMNIYEVIGFCWVVLTSALATVIIFYLAWIGFQVKVREGDVVVDTVVDAVVDARLAKERE